LGTEARRALIAAALLAAAPGRARAQDWHVVPPAVTFVASGGSWQVGTNRGYHRLLVIGGDADRSGPRLVIQWIQETANPNRSYVRQTQPIHAIEAPWVLGQPQFVTGTNGIRATITGTNATNHCTGVWTITLGPPGQYGVQPDRSATPTC